MQSVWGLGSFQVEGGGEASFDFDTRCRCGVIGIIIRTVNMAIFSWVRRTAIELETAQTRSPSSLLLPLKYSSWQGKGAKIHKINSNFLWTDLVAPHFVILTFQQAGKKLTFEPILEQTFKSALKWNNPRKSYTHAYVVKKECTCK